MIAKHAIFAVALFLIAVLALAAFAALPTVYHPAGDIMPGNFSEGGYAFPNASSKVGIGTASPEAILQTNKSGSGDQEAARFSATSGNPYITIGNGLTSTTGGFIIWDQGNSDSLGLGIHGSTAVLNIKDGNVGIGTTAPNAKLEVLGTDGNQITAGRTDDTTRAKLWAGTDGAVFEATNISAGAGLHFYINGSEKMRITDAGNVGIGTGSPDGLQVNIALSGETPRSIDNLRLGVLSGTPRIIFEDSASATQHEIDNSAGTMRFFRPGLVSMAIDSNGKVGIGTSSPDALLTIQGGATGSGLHIKAGENDPDYIMKVEDQDGSVQAMYINTNGNIGMGTTSPGSRLHVSQLIETGMRSSAQALAVPSSCGGSWATVQNGIWSPDPSTGCGDEWWLGVVNEGGENQRLELRMKNDADDNIYIAATGGVSTATADVAELMKSEDKLEIGDAVVIDRNSGMNVRKSAKTYDTLVAGIVSNSTRALTMALEEYYGKPDYYPIALVGRVKAKATAENGAIQVGDLLTTASTAGHLMRCEDKARCSGATAAKALEPLAQGKGSIMVLVTLQ